MSLTKEIQIEVEAFVARMTTLISNAALVQFQEAIGASAVHISPKSTKRAPAKAKGKPTAREKWVKRTPAELEKQTATLFAYISKHPGQRIEQISKALGITTKDLALPAIKLAEQKKIKTKGQKRATAYWAR